MSRRSRHSGSSISLFSFQDIMTAVMGVLILITLMLALELTASTDMAAASPPTPSDQADEPAATPQQIQRLRDQVDQLRQRHEQAVKDMQALAEAADDDQRQRQIAARITELTHLSRRLMQLQDQAKQAAAQVPQMAQTLSDVQDQLQQIEALSRQVARLEAAIHQQQQSPQLTYLVQKGQHKKPILLLVTDQAMAISRPGHDVAALWLSHPDADIRMRQLQSILRARDQKQEYVVILLKPSGFAQYHPLVAELRRQGFDVGTELIAEQTRLFPSPHTL